MEGMVPGNWKDCRRFLAYYMSQMMSTPTNMTRRERVLSNTSLVNKRVSCCLWTLRMRKHEVTVKYLEVIYHKIYFSSISCQKPLKGKKGLGKWTVPGSIMSKYSFNDTLFIYSTSNYFMPRDGLGWGGENFWLVYIKYFIVLFPRNILIAFHYFLKHSIILMLCI